MKNIIRRILKEENNRIIDRVVEHFIKNRCEFKIAHSLDKSNFIHIVSMDFSDGVYEDAFEFTLSTINHYLNNFIKLHNDETIKKHLHLSPNTNFNLNILKTLRSYGLTDDEVVETYIQILSKVKDIILDKRNEIKKIN